jgi:ATP phosphoribosyltransferase regulatory subunit
MKNLEIQSRWILPESISDVLPNEAFLLERLRRSFLDCMLLSGYELVQPPLVEYLSSLLTGVGGDLESMTFKFADGVALNTLGLRADTTPQVARIDAHVLHRAGVVRLCYASDVVRMKSIPILSNRQTLQIGAELFGVPSLSGDLEVLEVVLDTLELLRTEFLPSVSVKICFSNAAILNRCLSLCQDVRLRDEVVSFIRYRDFAALNDLVQDGRLAVDTLNWLIKLSMIDDEQGLSNLKQEMLPIFPEMDTDIESLLFLSRRVARDRIEVTFDLLDVQGFDYHSGVMWSVWVDCLSIPIARGGRYDGVGASFGRTRPATGFSIDARLLSRLILDRVDVPKMTAIFAPLCVESEMADVALSKAIKAYRESGEVVIRGTSWETYESSQFLVDRLLHWDGQGWNLKKL